MKVFGCASVARVGHNVEIAFRWTCNKSWSVLDRLVQIGKNESILGNNLGQVKRLKFTFEGWDFAGIAKGEGC
jgi:hypothetical protein